MFPEYEELEQTIKRYQTPNKLGVNTNVQILAKTPYQKNELAIYSVEIGSTNPDAPTLGVVGGIHGLERIGTWVSLAFMNHIHSRLQWDESLAFILNRIRIFFVPMVNPVGMMLFSRSNANGVDLMRNAPIQSSEPSFLVGGHHLSRKLPWFRGNEEQTVNGMEPELRALHDFVKAKTEKSSVSLMLDLHSGFGLMDQIWFPYAKQRAPFPFLSEMYALKTLFESTNPNHAYRFEPQAKHYCTHGDLWDYLLDQSLNNKDGKIFLPLTLEMGSWNWIKKNPKQLFSFSGPFNPILPHRMKRTLRRHLNLIEFLMQALSSPHAWVSNQDAQREINRLSAMNEWYSN